MENEKNEMNLINLDNNYNDISNKTFFQLEYHNQKINDKNIEFLKWKQSMKKIYGENAKLIKCSKDNILFYSTYKDCKSEPFYLHTCPKCKEQICFYCSKFVKENDYKKGICCLKRRMKYLFLYDGYGYINPIKNNCLNEYKKAFKYFITPIISFLLFSGTFQRILFEDLAFKNGKINNGIFETYLEHIEKFKYARPLPLIINDLTLIILVFFFYYSYLFYILYLNNLNSI